MKTLQQLVNEGLRALNEASPFDGLVISDKGTIEKSEKKPTRSRKKTVVKDSAQKETPFDKILLSLTDKARGHLLGMCFKLFSYPQYSAINKIYITLTNNDHFAIDRIDENVMGGKKVLITRDDIKSLLEEIPAKKISGIIKNIRTSTLASANGEQSEYYFKTTETEGARPILTQHVSKTGVFEDKYSRKGYTMSKSEHEKVGEKDINQLVLSVEQGSSGFKRADRLKLYSKKLTNKYVINSSAFRAVKIRGHEIYIFAINTEGGKAGVCIMGAGERSNIDPIFTPSCLSMLMDSLSKEKLTD